LKSTSQIKLIASPTSPYVRKVRVALAERRSSISWWKRRRDVRQPGPRTYPLGKAVLCSTTARDSSTRGLSSNISIPSAPFRGSSRLNRQRIAVKRGSAADGICDAASAIVMERRRPARQQSSE
jgi:glutathione S-transferase